MPACWLPWPLKRKATSRSPPSWRPARRPARCESRSSDHRCCVSATTTARRCAKACRPTCSVHATSASGCSGWASRCAASRAVAASRADSLRADSTSSCGPRRSGSAVRAGASSSTTCALVPPMPKELTPARRGRRPRTARVPRRRWHRTGCVSSRSAGFGLLKLTSGGSSRCCSASTVLMRPATPAAASRWPRLALSEPRRQKPVSVVSPPKACVSAAISIGIAERRRRAVRLDVADAACRHAGQRLRGGDDLDLAVHAGRGVAGLVRAVVVDGDAADHRVDGVAVGERPRQALEHHDARARTRHVCRAPGIERPAVAVGREDHAFLVQVTGALRKGDRHATGERHVAFTALRAHGRPPARRPARSSTRSGWSCSVRAGRACRRPACTGSPCRCPASADSRRPLRPAPDCAGAARYR